MTPLRSLFKAANRIGLYDLARLLLRRRLRILCYHGFSYADEHRFRPGLFMTPETFERRMEILAGKKYRVLGLEDALRALSTGSLPQDAVVLTFDDGWQGIADFAIPVLRKYGFPATIYVTTYYVSTQIPLINILVAYVAWKAPIRLADASSILPGESGMIDLGDPQARHQLASRVTDYCDRQLPPERRLAMCREYARALGVDLSFVDRGAFRLMNVDTLRQLSSEGFDIQLHGHRHRATVGPSSDTNYEIDRNRQVLRECSKRPLVHFCYPGGNFSPGQIDVLRGLGIESATTTRPGLVDRSTSLFELPRFLDAENLTEDKFEALVSGFFTAVDRLRP